MKHHKMYFGVLLISGPVWRCTRENIFQVEPVMIATYNGGVSTECIKVRRTDLQQLTLEDVEEKDY
jgi:hypothetical protein